MKTKRGH